MKVCIAQFEGIDNTPALPLAAGLLIASARRNEFLRHSCSFDIHVPRLPIAESVQQLQSSDLVGFSVYPWNHAYALQVISALKEAKPELHIVVGGPSIPKRPAAIQHYMTAHPAIDTLLLGEAEESFPQLLLCLLHSTDIREIPSVVCREETGLHIGRAVRVDHFSETGSPFCDGTFDALLTKYPGIFTMGMLETNRGCPFSCTFCDWSITKKVMEYPLQRIKDEIDWLVNRGFANFCIVDANFGIRPRDHLIAQHMAHKRKTEDKPSFCYFYLTKNNHLRNWETIQCFHDAGIHCTVGLAVQDFDDAVLKAIKRDNIQNMETNELRRLCADRAVPTRNELILGLPMQSYASVLDTLCKAMPPFPQHDFIIFLCRLLDNTELADPEQRERHQIESRHCQWVSPKGLDSGITPEFQELIVSTKSMPVADWIRSIRLCHLASMAYNKLLLRYALRCLTQIWGLSLQRILTHWAEAMAQAPQGSPLFDLEARLQNSTQSILNSGPYHLPLPELKMNPLELDDALCCTFLNALPDMMRAFEQSTRALIPECDWPKLHELFTFQEAILPHWQGTAVAHLFHWDWWGHWQDFKAQRLHDRVQQLQFQPCFIVSMTEKHDYLQIYLGLMQGKSITTQSMPSIFSSITDITQETVFG